MSAATPAEWVAFLSLGVGVHAALSAPYFVFVDADLCDFDPRPAVRRATGVVHQAAVHAGHDVDRMTATAQHAAALSLRDGAMTTLALLALLLPADGGLR